jgi:hypothetical protein
MPPIPAVCFCLVFGTLPCVLYAVSRVDIFRWMPAWPPGGASVWNAVLAVSSTEHDAHMLIINSHGRLAARRIVSDDTSWNGRSSRDAHIYTQSAVQAPTA